MKNDTETKLITERYQMVREQGTDTASQILKLIQQLKQERPDIVDQVVGVEQFIQQLIPPPRGDGSSAGYRRVDRYQYGGDAPVQEPAQQAPGVGYRRVDRYQYGEGYENSDYGQFHSNTLDLPLRDILSMLENAEPGLAQKVLNIISNSDYTIGAG